MENSQFDPENDEFWYIKNNDFTEYSFRFYNGGTCLERTDRRINRNIRKEIIMLERLLCLNTNYNLNII